MNPENPNWDGLLKWSLSHSDGTQPQRQISEDDRKWFMEAMQAQTFDVVKRMKEITEVMKTPDEVLESQGVSLEEIEYMLEELQEHVESIDMANDLHSIGGLVPLLAYLKNKSPKIRAKAADVVSTITQNNPKSQDRVMEANGLEPLITNFTSDSDITARTQALGAISSLIRHNKPGSEAFRLANGYAALGDALNSDNVRFQRKALSLLYYLLRETRSDCNVVTELGFLPTIVHLASSEDPTVREASLQCLLELSREKADTSPKMKELLEERIKRITMMSPENMGAVKEERQLIDKLWNLLYNEPSLLREKGLVVLPGEE